MKVIAYIKDPRDLANAQSILEWAMSEPTLKDGGAVHIDGKASFFARRKSGTVVIHVAPKADKK